MRAHAPRPRTLLRAGAALVVVIGLAALVAVYTPVAHPRDLEVKGATGPKAAAITEALESAARGQSTFAVSEKALMRAVAAYPEVAGVQVAAHPPLRLDLTVQMRVPVAIASSGSGAVTIASDGVVLDRGTERRLPRLDASLGDFSIREGRLRGNADGLKVLEAAPSVEPSPLAPGEILGRKRDILVGTAAIPLVVPRVQPAGRGAMPAADWWRGQRDEPRAGS